MAGCVILNSDINGVIDNLTIINLRTTLGPAFAFIDLKQSFKISNLVYKYDETVTTRPQISMFWSAMVTITNFTVECSSGNGIFYIQYQSRVNLENFRVANFICTNPEKGCILSVLSNSTLTATKIELRNMRSISSLVHVDNSTITAKELILESIYIDGQSEPFAFTCELAHFLVSTLSYKTFFGGFLFSDQSYLELSNFTISDNIFQESKDSSEISVLSLSKCLIFQMKNSSFQNIKTSANGGVHEIIGFFR